MFSECKIDSRGIVVFYMKSGEKRYISNIGNECRTPAAIAINGTECAFTYTNGDTAVFQVCREMSRCWLNSCGRIYKLTPYAFFAQPFPSVYTHVANVNKSMYYIDNAGVTHNFTTDAEVVCADGKYLTYHNSTLSPILPEPRDERFYYSVLGINIDLISFVTIRARIGDIVLAGPYMRGVKSIALRPNSAYPIIIKFNTGCLHYALNRKYQLEAENGECINIYDNAESTHYVGDSLYTIGGDVYKQVNTNEANLNTLDMSNYFERGVFRCGRVHICQIISKTIEHSKFALVYAK